MIRLFDDWLLLPQRIALHEPTATAVIADVHLGYDGARRRLGDAIPTRTVADEMQPLAAAANAHAICRLIVAGDLFERGYDADIAQQLHTVLATLAIELLAVIPGNHDRGIEAMPRVFPAGFDFAGWHICHGDQATHAPRAIIGHWHPAVRVNRRKVPAFLVRDQHLILPAFSRDAAGVDLRAEKCWREWQCLAICGNRVASERLNSDVAHLGAPKGRKYASPGQGQRRPGF